MTTNIKVLTLMLEEQKAIYSTCCHTENDYTRSVKERILALDFAVELAKHMEKLTR